jgi:integrase
MTQASAHLFRRNQTFYFRRRLPKPLANILGTTHIVRSLITTDAKLARIRARRLTGRLEDMSEGVTATRRAGLKVPTKADLDRILADIFTEILETGEQFRVANEPYHDAWRSPEQNYQPPLRATGLGENREPDDAGVKTAAENIEDCLYRSSFRSFQPRLERELWKRGLAWPTPVHEFRAFLRKFVATLAVAHRYDGEREQGRYSAPLHPFLSNEAFAATDFGAQGEQNAKAPISVAYAEFSRVKIEDEKSWAAASITHAQNAIALFVELKTDLPWTQIKRTDAADFKRRLSSLPALHGRSIYRDMPKQESIDLCGRIMRDIASGKDSITVGKRMLTLPEATAVTQRLVTKTVNRHLSFLREFYGWKTREVDNSPANPFDLLFKEKAGKKKNKRTPWQEGSLAELFATPVWAGSGHEIYRASRPGTIVYEDWRFWGPLLGLFTGMREEEVCNLRAADMWHDGKADSWILHVRKGKTVNAPRDIPVHSELLKIGLLEYRDAVVSAGHAILFPQFTFVPKSDDEKPPKGKDFPQAAFSKWFTRYRQELGIHERWMDFHALRHSFQTVLVGQYRGDELLRKRLMGWAAGDDVSERYFGGFKPSETAPVVASLDFPVDLQHLHLDNQSDRVILFRPASRRSPSIAPRGTTLRKGEN